MLLAFAGLRKLARGRRARPLLGGDGQDFLLTGTFYSDNWVASHIRPLAASTRCRRVRVVAIHPIPPIDRVEVIPPPVWLRRAVGGVPARLLTFAREAFRERPDWIGGFHLLVNGLVAGVLARLVGSRSLYFCVGGPAEVIDGGLLGENRIFSRLQVPDRVVERRLLEAVTDFDLVVTMGRGAKAFFEEHTTAPAIQVHGGGIDGGRFHPAGLEERAFDAIFVGRLAPIKRVDLFLETVQRAVALRPGTRALVVGDGSLRPSLGELARRLGIEGNVVFLGHRGDVEQQLRRAKVFMLTSLSEGLSLSVIEAMMSGLPAIVPAVGDLADLVQHGVNGFLVEGSRPEDFAARLLDLIVDPVRLESFRQAALTAARNYSLSAAMKAWDEGLRVFCERGGAGPGRVDG